MRCNDDRRKAGLIVSLLAMCETQKSFEMRQTRLNGDSRRTQMPYPFYASLLVRSSVRSPLVFGSLALGGLVKAGKYESLEGGCTTAGQDWWMRGAGWKVKW